MQISQPLQHAQDRHQVFHTPTPAAQQAPRRIPQPLPPAALLQRAAANPEPLTRAEALHLQRTLGNRAVRELLRGGGGRRIQPRLTLGPVGDPYEQEADRVARQVVQQLSTSTPQPAGQTVQRQEQEEERQRTPLVSALQRQELEDEDEVRLKPEGQRRPDGGGMAVSPDIEAAIQQTRGRGQLLPDTLRGPLEQAFGVDFSGVRVHADAQSDQLNRSIQAQAFTTGQDIFFRQGAYTPETRSGQEVLAHELTHVVQQTGDKHHQRNLVDAQQGVRSGADGTSATFHVDSLHSVSPSQGMLGQQLQRLLVIKKYNVAAGGYDEDKQLDQRAVEGQIRNKVTDKADREKVLIALQTMAQVPGGCDSVSAMARKLCEKCKRVTEDQVREAIGETLKAGPETNPSERKDFDKVQLSATSMSYEKGVPNVISLVKLEPLAPGVGNMIDQVLALDRTLEAAPSPALQEFPVGTWVTNLAGNLNVRTPHYNEAGWLPPGTTAERRGEISKDVETLVEKGQAKVQNANIQMSEEMITWYAVERKTPEERHLFLWHQYGGGHASPYIEIGGIGSSNGRLVFNYENQQFFWTIHYKWHKGFNPFFAIAR